MKYKNLHKWDLPPKDAIRMQYRLRDMVIIKKLALKKIATIAGVDISIKDNRCKAAIVVMSYPKLEILEKATHFSKVAYPYVPGLLTFREGPAIIECIKKITKKPDLFIFDGQGLAHPRKMGLASHMGIILNKPSVGSAKSHLYGSYKTPGKKKGDFSLIKDTEGNSIGAALCTRDGTKPIFVSPGHLIDINSSVKIILNCSPKYKIPEPVRAAHNTASFTS